MLIGELLCDCVICLFVDVELIENEVFVQVFELYGFVCVNVLMLFGLCYLLLVLLVFFECYLCVDIDFVFIDYIVDIVLGGFDVVICIVELNDLMLCLCCFCVVCWLFVVLFVYFDWCGCFMYLCDIEQYVCFMYINLLIFEYWCFCYLVLGDEVGVFVYGCICINNVDVIFFVFVGGYGLVLQFEFFVWDVMQCGEFEEVMSDWKIVDINVNFVMLFGMLCVVCVMVLFDFFVECFVYVLWVLFVV